MTGFEIQTRDKHNLPKARLQNLGEGNPGARVTLAIAYFLFFTRRVYKTGRVTLTLG